MQRHLQAILGTSEPSLLSRGLGRARGPFGLPLPFMAMLAACDGSSGGSARAFEQSAHTEAIIHDFADQVVVPTYALLAERLEALAAAVGVLQDSPTKARLQAAQEAWVSAREPWEQSEGFLFGPVETHGFDPALDSWPVNRTDLDAVLSSDDELTPAYVRQLDPTLQGFHTAEYLLFGPNRDRLVEELGSRELTYLVAVVEGMVAIGRQLVAGWTKGLDDSPAYRDVYQTAGDPDNRSYPSRGAAGQEIVFGMIGILDEVANGKIADPFERQDVRLVESQFSFNSLADFEDNLLSAENAYLGRSPRTQKRGTGLAVFVAEVDPALDDRIREQLAHAITALQQIPPPFREAILDQEAADSIRAAQTTIRTAHETLVSELLPLMGG